MKIREQIYLDRMIALLVESFGEQAVRQAIANSAQLRAGRRRQDRKSTKPVNGKRKTAKSETLLSTHDDLPEMVKFLTDIEHGSILSDVADIRRLAAFAGVKRLAGRSRRDMLRSLLRFLDSLSGEKLLSILHEAEVISATHRNDGLALLTSKILEGVASDHAEFRNDARRRGS